MVCLISIHKEFSLWEAFKKVTSPFCILQWYSLFFHLTALHMWLWTHTWEKGFGKQASVVNLPRDSMSCSESQLLPVQWVQDVWEALGNAPFAYRKGMCLPVNDKQQFLFSADWHSPDSQMLLVISKWNDKPFPIPKGGGTTGWDTHQEVSKWVRSCFSSIFIYLCQQLLCFVQFASFVGRCLVWFWTQFIWYLCMPSIHVHITW